MKQSLYPCLTMLKISGLFIPLLYRNCLVAHRLEMFMGGGGVGSRPSFRLPLGALASTLPFKGVLVVYRVGPVYPLDFSGAPRDCTWLSLDDLVVVAEGAGLSSFLSPLARRTSPVTPVLTNIGMAGTGGRSHRMREHSDTLCSLARIYS